MKPLLVIALLVFLPAGDGKELLPNGGFEAGLEGWRPLDMSKTTTFDLDTHVVNSGKQSLRMQRKGQGAADFLKAVIDIPESKGKLTCSIAYQVSKDSRARIDTYFSNEKVDALGKGYITLVDAKPTKGFEVARAEYDIPKGATKFGINIVMDKPGTIWIDTASVTLGAKANEGGKKNAAKKSGSNLIANGSFDENLDGWTDLAHGTQTSKTVRDTSVKATGAGSLKLTRTSPRLFPEDGVQASASDAGESKQFDVRFKARVAGGARAIVVAQAFDADGIVIGTERMPVESAAFAPGSMTLKLPDACNRIVVSFALRGAGDAWIDDVVLEGK